MHSSSSTNEVNISLDPSERNMTSIVIISIIATIGGFLFGFDSGVIDGVSQGGPKRLLRSIRVHLCFEKCVEAEVFFRRRGQPNQNDRFLGPQLKITGQTWVLGRFGDQQLQVRLIVGIQGVVVSGDRGASAPRFHRVENGRSTGVHIESVLL